MKWEGPNAYNDILGVAGSEAINVWPWRLVGETNSKSKHVILNSKLHYRACATICTLQNLNYRPWCGALL